jgi:hypothetical protein
MMSPAIDNPASCEIHAVIHLLHAENMSAAEIHCELCAVYSQKCYVKDGRANRCS